MARPVRSLLGRRFGRLKVQRQAPARPGVAHAFWICRCECGRAVEVRSDHLLSGRVVSCGCQRTDGEVRSRARFKIPKRVRRKLARDAIRKRWGGDS